MMKRYRHINLSYLDSFRSGSNNDEVSHPLQILPSLRALWGILQPVQVRHLHQNSWN